MARMAKWTDENLATKLTKDDQQPVSSLIRDDVNLAQLVTAWDC